ncbi:MAG TPA: hypothetical protein VF794_30165 [Archangium sp.]|jgi:hypothetical protein|uniref:hypothetical protein n=1 Tax=Archangium sp. TaxID=1872627 RepID=UPI002ED93584
MKRWLGWTMVLGLGGALATGCVSRQEDGAKQMGPPYTPLQEKYKSPSASEAESRQVGTEGTGGGGTEGITTDHWQDHPAAGENANTAQGPYILSQPQVVPRERRAAPLGVGGGIDSARQMANDQLESSREAESH